MILTTFLIIVCAISVGVVVTGLLIAAAIKNAIGRGLGW